MRRRDDTLGWWRGLSRPFRERCEMNRPQFLLRGLSLDDDTQWANRDACHAARSAELHYYEANLAEIWTRWITAQTDVPAHKLVARVGRLFGYMAAHTVLESSNGTA